MHLHPVLSRGNQDLQEDNRAARFVCVVAGLSMDFALEGRRDVALEFPASVYSADQPDRDDGLVLQDLSHAPKESSAGVSLADPGGQYPRLFLPGLFGAEARHAGALRNAKAEALV
jgi:hypothetical protein